ncbi:hypothetical protein E2C01_088600 [Portunus trituberculatus]|uniref:Uncharacterized protein n=1 Tax=Portunus trituberculatus TaxID=210409 RepID=A0A5B7JB69_PORTR|nr:hypothetical protein [Portunus trituberculatus]
MSLPCPSRSSL